MKNVVPNFWGDKEFPFFFNERYMILLMTKAIFKIRCFLEFVNINCLGNFSERTRIKNKTFFLLNL